MEAAAVDVVRTGLCVFSWFMEGAGPDSFDLPDSRLSRSMAILPELVQVAPSGTLWTLEEELLVKRSDWAPTPPLMGWRILLDGCRMFSAFKRIVKQLFI